MEGIAETSPRFTARMAGFFQLLESSGKFPFIVGKESRLPARQRNLETCPKGRTLSRSQMRGAWGTNPDRP
jgi:hypothetical protein